MIYVSLPKNPILHTLGVNCFPVRTAFQEPYAWMVYALAAFLDDVPLKPTKTLKSGMGNWITQASWPKKKLGASWGGWLWTMGISKGDFLRLDITTGCGPLLRVVSYLSAVFYRVELRLVNSERWFHPIFHRKVRPCELLFLCESYRSY